MRELVIICGMMGSGKTTFTKNICEMFDCEYIDFDKTYHNEVQVGNNNCMMNYVKYLDKKCSNNCATYIIDGWFTWNSDWYLALQDHSIKELSKIFDCVTLHFYQLDKESTIKNYYKKHVELKTNSLSSYKETYEVRLNNLKNKYKESIKWVE